MKFMAGELGQAPKPSNRQVCLHVETSNMNAKRIPTHSNRTYAICAGRELFLMPRYPVAKKSPHYLSTASHVADSD